MSDNVQDASLSADVGVLIDAVGCPDANISTNGFIGNVTNAVFYWRSSTLCIK